MKCHKCGGPMAQLFTSEYCVAECDSAPDLTFDMIVRARAAIYAAGDGVHWLPISEDDDRIVETFIAAGPKVERKKLR